MSKPDLFQVQVLASRDPRLSPTLPNVSIYSRNYAQDSDEDIYLQEVMNCQGGGSDENASFHSEDWIDEKVDGVDEKAKHVKIHVNPKFFPNLGANESPEKKDRDESRTVYLQGKDDPQSPRGRSGYGKRSGQGTMPEGAIQKDSGVEADNRIHKWIRSSQGPESGEDDRSQGNKSGSPERQIPTLISSGTTRRPQTFERMMEEPPPAAPVGHEQAVPQQFAYSPSDRFPKYQADGTSKAAISEIYGFQDPPKIDRYPASNRPSQPISRYGSRSKDSSRSSDPDRGSYRRSPDRDIESPRESSRERGRGRDKHRDSSRDRKYESASPRGDRDNPRDGGRRSRVTEFDKPQSPPSNHREKEVPDRKKTSRVQKPHDEMPTLHKDESPRNRKRSPEQMPPRSRPNWFEEVPASPGEGNRRDMDSDSSSDTQLQPLSRFSRKYIEEHETDITRVDDLVADRHVDLINDLDNVYHGRQAELEKEPFKHLSELSMTTQLESSFTESGMVRRVQMETMRDWMSKKPLDAYMLGRLKLGNYRPAPIPTSRRTDLVVQQKMREFQSEMHQTLRSGDAAKPDGPNVFPSPSSPTEETVGQVFRQVKHYMDFLSEKPHLSRRSKPPEILPSSRGGDHQRQFPSEPSQRAKREPDKFDDYYDRHSGADTNVPLKRVMNIPLEPDSPDQRGFGTAAMSDKHGMRTWTDPDQEGPQRAVKAEDGAQSKRRSRWGEMGTNQSPEDAMYSPTRPTDMDDADDKRRTEVQYVVAVAKKKKKDREKDDDDDDKKKDKKKKKKKDKDKDKEEKKDKDEKKKDKESKKDKKDKKKHKDKHKDKHDSSPDERKGRDLNRDHEQSYERDRHRDYQPDRSHDIERGRFRAPTPPKTRRPSRFDTGPSDYNRPPVAEKAPEMPLSPPRGSYQNPYTLAWGLSQYFLDTNLDLLMQMKEYCPNPESFVLKAETPENCFLWAIVLASHEKYISEHGEDLQLEHSTSSDTNEYGTSSGVNEYGSSVDKSAEKTGGWVTVQEGKDSDKRDPFTGIPAKLTPQQAAKKPAPKSAKPLFKPPMAFMLNLKSTPAPPENDNYKEEDMDLGSDTEEHHEIAKAWKLLDSKIFDDTVRDAFEAFARESSRLVREKYSMSSMTKLAREAQLLIMESAEHLKHFSSLCTQSYGLYKHLRDDAVKLEKEGTSPMDIHMALKGRSPVKRGLELSDLNIKKRAKMDETGSGRVDISRDIKIPFEDKLSNAEASKLARISGKTTSGQKLSGEELINKVIAGREAAEKEKEAAEKAAVERAAQEAIQNVDIRWNQPFREREHDSTPDPFPVESKSRSGGPRPSRWNTSKANSLFSNLRKKQLAKKKERELQLEQEKELEKEQEKEAEEKAADFKAKIIHMVGVAKKKVEPDEPEDADSNSNDDDGPMQVETPEAEELELEPVPEPEDELLTEEPPVPGIEPIQTPVVPLEPIPEEMPPVPEPMEEEPIEEPPQPPMEPTEPPPSEPAPIPPDLEERPPLPDVQSTDTTSTSKKKKKKKKEKELESIPLPPGMGEVEPAQEPEPKKFEITAEYKAEILRRAQEHMNKMLAGKKPTQPTTIITESQPGAVAEVIQQAAQKAVAKQAGATWYPPGGDPSQANQWNQWGQQWGQQGDGTQQWGQQGDWSQWQGQQWYGQGQWGAQGQWGQGQWGAQSQWGRANYPSGAYYEEGPHLYPPGTLIRKAVFGENIPEEQQGAPVASHVNFYIFNQDKPIIGAVKVT